MAIEIKELVLRVSVNKSIQQAQDQYVTKHELSKNRKALTDEILRKVETMLRDAAERR